MYAVEKNLLAIFVVDFAFQFLFYVPSAILRTEKLYDLSGAFTYFSCILVGLLWRQDALDKIELLSTRQIIVATLVLVWCTRLGTWLFVRVLKEGKDSRFDELKKNPITYAVPWFFQALWIFVTALPAYIVLGNPGFQQRELIWSDMIGIIVWAFGFIVEIIADYQKNVFKRAYPHDFVNVGIWRWSRYANYNGEITLWIGMLVLCANGFVESWQWVAIISPVFVTCLIFFVSGIRLLEKSAEEKYGQREDFRVYKASTSKFFLWPPKRNV
jgi:steroid 5-alpha reductase family enzyme